MPNPRYYKGISAVEERAADEGAFKEEIENVTEALRNDDVYFHCNDGSGVRSGSDVVAVGMSVPEKHEPNRGYVFARECDDRPVSYGFMQLEEGTWGVQCTEYAENIAYSDMTDLQDTSLPKRRHDAYFELLYRFSDTPKQDVRNLDPSYEPNLKQLSRRPAEFVMYE